MLFWSQLCPFFWCHHRPTQKSAGWTQAAPRHHVASPSRTCDRNSPSVHSSWRPPARYGSTRHPMNFGRCMFLGFFHPWMLIPRYHYTHLHALLYVYQIIYIYTHRYRQTQWMDLADITASFATLGFPLQRTDGLLFGLFKLLVAWVEAQSSDSNKWIIRDCPQRCLSQTCFGCVSECPQIVCEMKMMYWGILY